MKVVICDATCTSFDVTPEHVQVARRGDLTRVSLQGDQSAFCDIHGTPDELRALANKLVHRADRADRAAARRADGGTG